MVKRYEVYKCEICGNIVEVLHEQDGILVCCGKPMVLKKENTIDAAAEKHVPVIETIPNGARVTIGSVEHPMIKSHYIEWIEILADDKIYRKYLNPGEKPQAEFCINAEKIVAREYCNLHGLWKGE